MWFILVNRIEKLNIYVKMFSFIKHIDFFEIAVEGGFNERQKNTPIKFQLYEGIRKILDQ